MGTEIRLLANGWRALTLRGDDAVWVGGGGRGGDEVGDEALRRAIRAGHGF